MYTPRKLEKGNSKNKHTKVIPITKNQQSSKDTTTQIEDYSFLCGYDRD